VLSAQIALASVFDEKANQTYRKIDNSLTIHITPSTYRLDWSNARNLLISILKNQYIFPKTSSLIGHVTAEVNCTVGNKQERFFLG
jgi:hypothetical protein